MSETWFEAGRAGFWFFLEEPVISKNAKRNRINDDITATEVRLIGADGEQVLLENAYRNSFDLALANGVRSIAFPAISTGVYGYPKQQAANVAIRQMLVYDDRFERIVAVCFSEQDKTLYESVLQKLLGD